MVTHVLDLAPKREPLLGLTAAEVLEQRSKHGENVLPASKGQSVWSILFSQFKSPLVYIILVAGGISLAAGEYSDFAIIMAVVVIDVILGFVQEYQAHRTYTALKGLLKPTTTVIRDGARQEIDIRELVPGDLVVLNAGERVPGDGQVVDCTKLAADEAILTGESEPVNKSTGCDQGQVYMGTTVVTGRGLVSITGTGSRTELGQIATSLQENPQEETPLQVRLRAFSTTLTYLVVGITLVILVTGLISGRSFLEMLRVSIVLAIAAVPEGLLIAVTVILVLGMRKILKRNGLVRKLLAVETLGSVTVICTDKTGTLTEGRMRVTRSNFVDRERSLETMALCNDMEGPVEIALWEFATAQLARDPQDLVDGCERLAEELFTSETKFMITAARLNGKVYNHLKGAPEIVLEMCQVSAAERSSILAQVDEWAGEGLRLLGLAYRANAPLDEHSGYTWVGLIGMEDPIREGVLEAVQVAHRAGIKVKMITGDYRRTAERIAANIGLSVGDGQVLEGHELAGLTDAQLADRAASVVVFARIRPQDKLRIVRALQERGEIAAMIGDGVNDAPALQRANIGVVVGSATDVARETADLILLDNNFRTVVAAVEEGRVIFENIRKVVAYVLSNSFAEVTTIFVAMLLGWPAPLLVAQILWIHLICDGPADIMLGFEPKEAGIMDEPPKSLSEPILTRLGLSLIAVISLSSSIIALFLFEYFTRTTGSEALGRSYVFATFAVNSMVYIFAYRSMRQPILRSGSPMRNKPLVAAVAGGLVLCFVPFVVPPIRDLLQLVPLGLGQWGLVLGVAFFLLMVVEVGKFVSRRAGLAPSRARGAAHGHKPA